jgi:hypothetical protein
MKYSLVFLGLVFLGLMTLVSATISTPNSSETMESRPSELGVVPGKFSIPICRGEHSEKTVERDVRLPITCPLFSHN